jgi:hypothetical protein
MHMLSSVIKTKIPASPRSPTTPVAQSASLSVIAARTRSVEIGTGREGSVGATMNVPLFDPTTAIEPLRAQIDAALLEVSQSWSAPAKRSALPTEPRRSRSPCAHSVWAQATR